MENKSTIDRNWLLFDASKNPVGRICTEVATALIGKNKTNYAPNKDVGDHVVVINTDKLYLTGDKENSKRYYRHSGYIGSTKTIEFKEAKEKDSRFIIEKAVLGMLPKNKLMKGRAKRLHLYKNETHAHQNIKFVN